MTQHSPLDTFVADTLVSLVGDHTWERTNRPDGTIDADRGDGLHLLFEPYGGPYVGVRAHIAVEGYPLPSREPWQRLDMSGTIRAAADQLEDLVLPAAHSALQAAHGYVRGQQALGTYLEDTVARLGLDGPTQAFRDGGLAGHVRITGAGVQIALSGLPVALAADLLDVLRDARPDLRPVPAVTSSALTRDIAHVA